MKQGSQQRPANKSPGKDPVRRAIWRGQVLAESDRALEVGGYVYFPREAVRAELLHAAPKTPSDRQCPHGVQFYDVGDGDAKSPRAAWSYEAPGDAMRAIDRWIAFWEDVEVAATPAAPSARA